MESNSFYSKSLHESSPLRALGISRMIAGILVFFYAIPSLLKIEVVITSIIDEEYDRIVQLGPQVLVGILLLISSLSIFLKGLKGLRKVTISPNDPPEFQNYGQVIETLIKGKLDIYKLPEFGPLKFAYNYVSDKVPFLKPSQRRVVIKNVSFLRKYLVLLLLIFLLFFAQRFVPVEVWNDLEISTPLLKIPVLFLIVFTVLLGVSFYSIFLLIPGNIPKQDIKERIASIKGGGDPNQFCPMLEKSFYQFRFNSLPNRSFKTGFEKIEELSFNETGSFEGKFIMESHPKYVGSSNQSIVPYLYIALGFMSLLFALFYFNRMGQPGLITVNQLAFITFNLLGGFVLYRTAMNFFKRASLLLNIFTYESLLVYVEIEGTIGKTEITAGKAITDSIETRNVVIRSDSQLKLFTTLIQSENKRIVDQRYISAMVVDEKVNEVLDSLVNEINNFRDEGVAVRGVDISSESISQITQANVKIQGAKRAIKSENVLDNPVKASLEEKATENTSDSLSKDGNKECPQCAEMVKEKAKICRFCRYEF